MDSVKILVPISLPYLYSLLWWYNIITYYHSHPDSPQIGPPEKFSCELQICTWHLHFLFNKSLWPNILKTKILKRFLQNMTLLTISPYHLMTILSFLHRPESFKLFFSPQVCIYFLRNSIVFSLLNISKYINGYFCFPSHSYFVWIVDNAS